MFRQSKFRKQKLKKFWDLIASGYLDTLKDEVKNVPNLPLLLFQYVAAIPVLLFDLVVVGCGHHGFVQGV
jgi:hypothetical protein